MIKTVKWIIIGVVCTILAAIIAFPFVYFHLETIYIRNSLNNPIIDSKYSGWHTVELEEGYTINIPDGWTLKTGEQLSLYDDTGKQIAFGTRFRDYYLPVDEYFSFLSQYYSDAIESYTTGQEQIINDNLTSWLELNYSFQSGKKRTLMQEEFNVMSKDKSNYIYVLLFENPNDELHEIATAMIYSGKRNWIW